MKAHIVGGGFGGLAAAAYLIRNAGVPGQDITIYEADERMGGGFFLGGSAKSGYNLPGSVFDAEFRCTFDLLADDPLRNAILRFPSRTNSSPSMRATRSTTGRTSSIATAEIVHGPHYGLSLRDGFDLVRLSLTPEARLDGRRIEEFFSPHFFQTEFWLLWSTIMGSLPQHGATEFRRYINRALALVPRPVGHAAHPAHAVQPVPGVHRTAGRLAAGARREVPDRRLRPRHRLGAGAGPHHGQTARLRAGRRGEPRSRSGRRISCW